MFEAFAIWLVTVVLNIAGGSALGTALIVAITIAVPVGLSMAATRLLAPKMPSYSDLAGRGVMTRNPVAPRQIIYGQTKVSGPIVYLATSGAKNQFLHIVVALAGHQVEEIGDVYFNEDLVLTGAGDGYGSGIFSDCLIHKKLGTSTQTVDTTLEADFPTEWDSSHRLRGIAYVYVKLTYSAEVFPGGIPNVSAVVKGKLVYNPTGGATAYSANPALCLRDYLTDADLGLGMTTAEIDDTACAAAAAVCDVAVAHLPSGTEARYECNGQTVTSATPDSIIGQLLSSMAGNIAYSGGKVVMYAGSYRTPTVTLTEAHLAGAVSVTTRASARDRVNAVKGTYISAANQWTAADFPSIYSSTYTSEDNGIAHWRDVVLPFTTSSSAAQRIAVINLRQARQEIVFSAKFNLNAMQLRAGDTVMITNAKFGWTAKVFQVIEWALANDGTPPQPVIAMTLRETDSTVYAWDVGDEIAVESAPNTYLPDPFTVADPTSLALRSDDTTATYQYDGTYVPRISVTWVAPSDEFVQSGGKVQVQYKVAASTTFVDWSLVPGDQTQEYITDVNSGVLYTVALYSINFFGVTGSVITANVTAATNLTASANPTSFLGYNPTSKSIEPSTNGGTPPLFLHGMTLEWTPSVSRDVDFIEIGYDFVGSSTVTPPSAWRYKVPAAVATKVIYGVGLTGYIWVRTTNFSGVVSTPVYTGIDFLTYGVVPLVLGTVAAQSSASVSITGGTISGITDIALADGGTGASTAAGARTNLELGTISTQASSSVSITGGAITGITDIAVADGGTGASTAAGALANLNIKGVTERAFVYNGVLSIAGGATTWYTEIDITSAGFTAAPSGGVVVVEDTLYAGFYDSQYGSNSSTKAYVKFYRIDGANLSSGNLRLSAVLFK